MVTTPNSDLCPFCDHAHFFTDVCGAALEPKAPDILIQRFCRCAAQSGEIPDDAVIRVPEAHQNV